MVGMTRIRGLFLGAFAAGLLTSLAAPAVAQEAPSPGEDWVLTESPDQKLTAAVAAFTSGIGIIARCQNGAYDVFIAGLPKAPRDAYTREIGLEVGDDGEIRTTVWTVGSDRSTAFSRLPAIVARQLAEGGKLQIVVPGAEGEPRTRYVMALNPSSRAIETTLTACGRLLVDPRDHDVEGNGQDGLPDGIVWAQTPQLRFPPPIAGRSITDGYVALSCVSTADGRLENCQVESEQPPRFNLARNVQRAVLDARVRLSDEAAAQGERLEDRVLVFTVVFRMASD